jgi:hypothetical protein
MIKVFISSPYTLGDVAVNVKNSLDIADQLMTLGFAPYAPLLSHFQHIIHPRPYQDWMDLDVEYVKSSDCILRLPGESKGADHEVSVARFLGIPVFLSIEELTNHYYGNKA